MRIAVVSGYRQSRAVWCNELNGHGYQTMSLHSVGELKQGLNVGDRVIVLLDLDTVEISDSEIRRFKKANPEIELVALSRHPFHPELTGAMRDHIYACLSKPVDVEELLYWITTIEHKTG